MGLGMRLKTAFSTLLLALALASASACLKKPGMEDEDGEPASAESVQNAIVEAWGSVSPLTIGASEFSYTEKEMAIGDMPGRVVLQEGKTVTSRTDTPTERVYVIHQQVAEIDSDNKQKTSTFEREIKIEKKSSSVMEGIRASSVALPLSVELAQNLLYTCVKGKGWDVSCFNLKTWESTDDTPAEVAKQPGCQGLTDCKWRQKNVSFDIVLTSKDEKTGVTTKSKATYTVRMSPDVPYLSRITEFCYQGIGSAQNTHFPVTVCQKIKNFRR